MRLRTKLTRRELQVLSKLCKGLSNKQIGDELKISSGTVKIHVSTILDKLNATNRTHATAMVLVRPRRWKVGQTETVSTASSAEPDVRVITAWKLSL